MNAVPSDRPADNPRASWLLVGGALAAFALVTVALWPSALSFGDEVGYIGQARLLLAGQITPTPESPGAFDRDSDGLRLSRYPLFVPAVLTPLVAIHPRLVFALGLISLVISVVIAATALRRWGADPALALLLAVHPTFVLLARTAMADLWLTAAALAAWWLDENGARRRAALLFALVVAIKPSGLVIAAALIAGVMVRARGEGASLGAIARRIAPALAGALAGGALVAALNWVAWRHLGYRYDVILASLGVPPFSVRYLATTGATLVLSLVLVPPGLLAGAWGLWRRRQLGPLFVVIALVGMMGVYFFVDRGRSRPQTLVLAQRLVLPASAFLLLGLATLVSPLAWAPRLGALVGRSLAAAAPVMAFVVGFQHHAWQRSMHEAVIEAGRIAAQEGSKTLGATASALKVAMMYPGPVTVVGLSDARPRVVLCSLVSSSYRRSFATSCDLPGYEVRESRGMMRILVAR